MIDENVKKQVLREWLEGEFKEAITSDTKRLLESLWMMKISVETGDSAEMTMGIAIASFVGGLIEGQVPITIPIENN